MNGYFIGQLQGFMEPVSCACNSERRTRMTDLTPEQIDQYADDRIAERHWQSRLDYALRTAADYRCKVPGILHAHAKMLRMEAENARLTALIEEHNKKCSRIFCAYPRCSEREFQRCEKCPLDMMIDTERKES